MRGSITEADALEHLVTAAVAREAADAPLPEPAQPTTSKTAAANPACTRTVLTSAVTGNAFMILETAEGGHRLARPNVSRVAPRGRWRR